jgi:hypothetical protein
VTVQHERFLERLAASSQAVFLVARMQYAKGRTVEIPRMQFAPTAAQADDYVDAGDLIIVQRHRIEVKHLSINFTCAADWPFNEVFVSNVAAVDRANNDVLAYVSVSQDMRHIAIVERSTRSHWYVVQKPVSNTGNVERNYACPLVLVDFEATPPEFL